MRNDMYDVLLDRSPPKGWSRPKPGRPARDIDDAPSREKVMRREHWFSLKSLNPLRRYLASQAGQPWNDVYAQLCASRRAKDAAHHEIFSRIGWLVALDVCEISGVLHAMHSWRGLLPLAEVDRLLYVDPHDGRLAINEFALRSRAEMRREHSQRVKARQLGLEPDLRRLSERRQLRRIDGIWYEIELIPVPPQPEPRKPEQRRRSVARAFPFDAITRKKVTHHDEERCRMYGSCKLYAARKRQLSGAELIEHGLSNGAEPDPYLQAIGRNTPRRPGRKYRGSIRNLARQKDYHS